MITIKISSSLPIPILHPKNSEDIYIKTHGSESRGQEEAGLRDERVSYLQVTPL